jgi:hypothetical protein
VGQALESKLRQASEEKRGLSQQLAALKKQHAGADRQQEGLKR